MPNDLFNSAELRWFLEQPDQWDQTLAWYIQNAAIDVVTEGDTRLLTQPCVKLEKEHTDEYLLLQVSEMVGIKKRQGKLEVKALVAGPRPFSCADMVSGRMDQWVKWSLESKDAVWRAQLQSELALSGNWLSVKKRRYLQKYSFDSGDSVNIPPDHWPRTGCNIELTRVGIRAKVWDWFTIGFEAFGSPNQVVAILDEAVQHFFTAHGPAPVRLDGRSSFSYPAWIATLSWCAPAIGVQG